MALSFTGGSTDKITVTNPQTFGSGTEFAYLFWGYRTAGLSSSEGTNKNGADIFIHLGGQYFGNIPRATTNAERVTSDELLPLDTWAYVAVTYSEADGMRLFGGTLTALAAEASYASETVGSGATSADSGDLFINNRSAASSLAMAMRIGCAAWYSRRLTLAQVQEHQFLWYPRANCQFLGQAFSTSSVPDLSGNVRNGAVTGTTIAAHVPIPFFLGEDALPYAVAVAEAPFKLPELSISAVMGRY